MRKIKHEQKNISWYEFPCCLIVADHTKYEEGDFMEIARIMFSTGEITLRENSIIPEETMNRIYKEANKIKNNVKR